jgi:diguanylate cyclase (GGDEF)-like protein
MRRSTASHARPIQTEAMTKRTLIVVSHAIEQAVAVRAANPDEPVVLMALFQRPLYFDRERTAYCELSKAATVTIVGMVDALPDVPPGVEGVALRPDEPLAAEWSVVMLTPRAGACLVAVDQEQLAPGEVSVEQGRLFDGWWSFRRSDALEQAGRLQSMLGDRISRRAHTVLDDVLEEATARRSSAAEVRANAAVRLIVHRLEQANLRTRRMERTLHDIAPHPHRDPVTDLRTREWLTSWAGPSSGTASGTLPLTLMLVDLPGLADVVYRYGNDVGDDVLRRVAALLRAPLREVDHAVRLGHGKFLLVLPGLSKQQAHHLANRLRQDICTVRPRGITDGDGQRARTTVLVTSDRPLPLDLLEDDLLDLRPFDTSRTPLIPRTSIPRTS